MPSKVLRIFEDQIKALIDMVLESGISDRYRGSRNVMRLQHLLLPLPTSPMLFPSQPTDTTTWPLLSPHPNPSHSNTLHPINTYRQLCATPAQAKLRPNLFREFQLILHFQPHLKFLHTSFQPLYLTYFICFPLSQPAIRSCSISPHQVSRPTQSPLL